MFQATPPGSPRTFRAHGRGDGLLQSDRAHLGEIADSGADMMMEEQFAQPAREHAHGMFHVPFPYLYSGCAAVHHYSDRSRDHARIEPRRLALHAQRRIGIGTGSAHSTAAPHTIPPPSLYGEEEGLGVHSRDGSWAGMGFAGAGVEAGAGHDIAGVGKEREVARSSRRAERREIAEGYGEERQEGREGREGRKRRGGDDRREKGGRGQRQGDDAGSDDVVRDASRHGGHTRAGAYVGPLHVDAAAEARDGDGDRGDGRHRPSRKAATGRRGIGSASSHAHGVGHHHHHGHHGHRHANGGPVGGGHAATEASGAVTAWCNCSQFVGLGVTVSDRTALAAPSSRQLT
jgi:hypothetical protein